MTTSATTKSSAPRVLGAIGAAHFISHYYLLVLPPMFPLLQESLGVSYSALGLLVTTFAIVSGVSDVPVGFLVDRFGARRILLAGLLLEAGAFLCMGLFPVYPVMLGCMALAGLANSVYHPSDYSILSASVDETRMGRAFSLHSFAGFFGGAVAPATTVFIVSLSSWRMALLVTGMFGLAIFVFVLINQRYLQDRDERSVSSERRGNGKDGLALLFSLPIMMCFLFFLMLSMSQGGLNTFSVSAFVAGYGFSLEGANAALTGFLIGGAVGILLGGYVADRTVHHERVAMLGFFATAVIVFLIGQDPINPIVATVALLTGGLLYGMIMPSRDMLVRAVTPPQAMGKVFGFVSTGLNLGGAITPLLFGYILDQGAPKLLFYFVPLFMLLGVSTVVATKLAQVKSGDQSTSTPTAS